MDNQRLSVIDAVLRTHLSLLLNRCNRSLHTQQLRLYLQESLLVSSAYAPQPNDSPSTATRLHPLCRGQGWSVQAVATVPPDTITHMHVIEALQQDIEQTFNASLWRVRAAAAEQAVNDVEALQRVGVLRLFVENNSLYLSAAAARLLGFSAVIPNTLNAWLSGFLPVDAKGFREALQQAAVKGTSFDLTLPFLTGEAKTQTLRITGQRDYIGGHEAYIHGALEVKDSAIMPMDT